MSNKIDEIGVYRGEVIEAAFKRNRNNNPMFVVTIRADERYVDDTATLKSYLDADLITEEVPQWVPWTEYDQTIRNNMTLFSPKTEGEVYTEDNATLNYRQCKEALGWDGTSFDELGNDTFVGKKVLIRVGENTYEPEKYGPVDVKWLDAFDAPPTRELKSMDQSDISALNKRLKISKKATSKTAAAPKSSAGSRKTKPATSKTTTKTKASSVQTAPPAASTPPSSAATPPAPAPEGTEDSSEFTKEEAWNSVYKISSESGQEDTAITDQWIAAVGKVAEQLNAEEDSFAPEDWAQVRHFALESFSLVA